MVPKLNQAVLVAISKDNLINVRWCTSVYNVVQRWCANTKNNPHNIQPNKGKLLSSIFTSFYLFTDIISPK